MSNLENLQKLHKSVLKNETLGVFKENFALSNKRLKIIDATLGLGGHTEEFVKKGANVLGIDQDEEMLESAKDRLTLACPTPEKDFQGLFKLVKGNFKDVFKIASENGFMEADGIIFDLGVSSPQITSPTRGFSFQNDSADLDMRMNTKELGVKASDLLNVLRLDQLTELFNKVMLYSLSKKLATEITKSRKLKPIKTVGDFKEIIAKVDIKRGKKKRPETLPFLALRIAVNNELENIEAGLTEGLKVLGDGGKLVVISFHSLEDILVAKTFKSFERDGLGKASEAVYPSELEIAFNVRSRSAILRVFTKNEKEQFGKTKNSQ